MAHSSWPVPPAATASTWVLVLHSGTVKQLHEDAGVVLLYLSSFSDLDPMREYLKEAVGVVGRFVPVVPRAAGSVYGQVLHFPNYFFSSECCHDNRRCESLKLRRVGWFYQQRRFIRDRFIQRKSS